MAHVAPWKFEYVDFITKVMDKYPVIGLVNVQGIPAKQLMKMRGNLRQQGLLVVSKKTLLKLAIENVKANKSNLEAIEEHIDGQVGIMATDMNSFQLFKELEKTKAKAPAKGGELSPEDITIEKGETSFKPGPIVGEMQKAGLPAAIEKGKIVIRKTVTPVKAGEAIPAELAQILTKMDIYPLEVGLDLLATYEDGEIFNRDVLDVDPEEYLQNLKLANMYGFNLAMEIGWASPTTIRPMLQLASMKARNLSINAAIPTSETIKTLLALASMKAMAIARAAPDALDEETKAKLQQAPAPAAAPEPAPSDDTEKKEDEEDDEEDDVSEEEAAAGLGALFG